jgi:hypothetical protein
MTKRSGTIVLVALFGGLVSAQAARGDLRPSAHRPALIEVGEPIIVDRSTLRREMERISDLKDHIARNGWPDYAEVQSVVAEDFFGDYEVRVYYLLRQREADFAHVDAAPWVKDFGIKRYEGPIPTETLGRLLTARPLSEPAMYEEPPPPPPPAVVSVVEPAPLPPVDVPAAAPEAPAEAPPAPEAAPEPAVQ